MSVDPVNLAPLWSAIIVAAISGLMFWLVHRPARKWKPSRRPRKGQTS